MSTALALETGEQKKARVLVVDDDAAFCGIVADVLATLGYEAESVNDPEEALARAERTDFAAAIVDLIMPGMSGLDLAERLHVRAPDMQVVVLTGHPDFHSAVEGIKRGVFAYLQKDQARIGVLDKTLAEAVARWRTERESARRLGHAEDANRRLQVLQEQAATLAEEVHSDALMRKAVELARETCLAANARLVLFEAGPDGPQVVAAEGEGTKDIVGRRLDPGEGIATEVAEGTVPVHVADPASHHRYSRRCDGPVGTPPGLLAAPLRFRDVRGVLVVAGRLSGAFTPDDGQRLALVAQQAAIALENARQHERFLNFFTHTSDILVSFLEALDIHHPGHSRGVAALADLTTRRLGLSHAERRSVHFAALLHDIGKVKMDRRLLAAGALSPEGLAAMQEHPRLGVEILRPIAVWEDLLRIILAHHERWDGKGYPNALAGDAIPLGARVVAVADAFDAMGRGTSYRSPLDEAAAIAELEAGAGAQFDPRIVRLFVAAFRENGDPRSAT